MSAAGSRLLANATAQREPQGILPVVVGLDLHTGVAAPTSALLDQMGHQGTADPAAALISAHGHAHEAAGTGGIEDESTAADQLAHDLGHHEDLARRDVVGGDVVEVGCPSGVDEAEMLAKAR
jgi:hypothetical protein